MNVARKEPQVFKSILIALIPVAGLAMSAFAEEKPNIIFVLADDVGLGDVSFHARHVQKKEPFVETPTIDSLAAQGLWFTDGHSSPALCAPTRYATMSGNNNYRSYSPTGVWSTFAPTAFKEGEVTLGTVVRDAGYRTGFIGKWHMGGDFHVQGSKEIYRGPKSGDLTDQVDVTRWAGSGPRYCGFDYDFVSPCGVQGPLYLLYENEQWYPWASDSEIVFFTKKVAKFPQDVSDKGPGPGDSNWDARQLGDKFSSKAVNFIKRNAASDRPFFLYYCASAVHVPHRPPEQLDGTKIKGSTPTLHLDMMTELDTQIKRMVDALKETGEFENTLFVFTSDNGGLQDAKARKLGYEPAGGWKGSKNMPFEGGHRVPFFAVWPGRIEPGMTHEIAASQDMVATFAALVGTSIPDGQAMDSLNLLPLLMGDESFEGRDYFANQAGSKQELMYRKMPWKLIIQSNLKRTKFEFLALYNLEDDPHEDQNKLDDPELESIANDMLIKYMEIVQSGRPTVPGR